MSEHYTVIVYVSSAFVHCLRRIIWKLKSVEIWTRGCWFKAQTLPLCYTSPSQHHSNLVISFLPSRVWSCLCLLSSSSEPNSRHVKSCSAFGAILWRRKVVKYLFFQKINLLPSVAKRRRRQRRRRRREIRASSSLWQENCTSTFFLLGLL